MEYVLAKDVFRFIDKAFPRLPNKELALMVDRSQRRIFDLRRQEKINFYVADDLLSKLDLSYLLSTGDIPVYKFKYGDGSYLRTEESRRKERERYARRMEKKRAEAPKPYDHEAVLKRKRESQARRLANA